MVEDDKEIVLEKVEALGMETASFLVAAASLLCLKERELAEEDEDITLVTAVSSFLNAVASFLGLEEMELAEDDKEIVLVTAEALEIETTCFFSTVSLCSTSAIILLGRHWGNTSSSLFQTGGSCNVHTDA